MVCICTWHYEKQDFQEILDKIQEIILTFRSSHVLFLVGDMNSSMMERLGNGRDKLLECFLSENPLLHSQDGTCTFIHSKDSSSSEIDCIFCSEDGANLVNKVDVLSDHLNVLDHLPVIAELKKEKPGDNVESRIIDT